LAGTPDPLDVTVGARIALLRNRRGMCQGELAGKVGITFQQVQNYEKGTDRIGVRRLSRVAAVLGVSVGELFDSSENESTVAKSSLQLLAERDALRVLKAFSRTTSPRVRRAFIRLLESVADRQPAVNPPAAKRRRRISITPA
jgi:transcriptional regulator with XRE-family HTH domain